MQTKLLDKICKKKKIQIKTHPRENSPQRKNRRINEFVFIAYIYLSVKIELKKLEDICFNK